MLRGARRPAKPTSMPIVFLDQDIIGLASTVPVGPEALKHTSPSYDTHTRDGSVGEDRILVLRTSCSVYVCCTHVLLHKQDTVMSLVE
jgi:hypothetical protein